MRATGVLLLSLSLAACGAATGATSESPTAVEIETNEALAISNLQSLVGAQLQAQALGVVDTDQDAMGEFLFLAELAGREPRKPGEGLRIPLLAGEFASVDKSGSALVQGYRIQVFLPGPDGSSPVASAEFAVDPEAAERGFLAYAWPDRHGQTGRRTFFVKSSGEIHALDLGGRTPESGTALVDGTSFDRDVLPEWKKVD